MPYVAIVLDDSPARDELLKRAPKGWRPICHHITLAMGRPKEGSPLERAIGVHVNDIRLGRVLGDDQVIAVEVELPAEIRALCTNRVPHVTIAVNSATGGKPVMSNFLPWSAAGGDVTWSDLTISGTILAVK